MRRLAGFAFAAALSLSALPAVAQQRPDAKANVSVTDPSFAKGTGPVIGIDSGHRELQTIGSGFSTFAALLGNDGYQMQDFHAAFTPANLAKVKVLVIANPRGTLSSPTGSPLDSLSAFSDDEIDALHDWVEGGGALLITADHPPFAGTVRALAASYGFTINRFAAYPPGWPTSDELFNASNGGLIAGPLTDGVPQVETFFGTAFTAPAGASALLKLNSGWSFEQKGKNPTTPIPATSDDWRGATLVVGKGRVVLMGETGELTAQISAKGELMGFNAPDATGNKQFIRNIAYWLATGQDPKVPPATVN